MPPFPYKRVALVLGGGGFKGFAHIGVIRALEECGIEPVIISGTSIGALVAAAYASGLTVSEMGRKALAFRRRDLFRLNHLGMVLERMRSPSIYLEPPLRSIVESIVPKDRTFDDLPRRLLVTTFELERGIPMVWGLPGMRHVRVADAVYASCALPGFFPAGVVNGNVCVDGGVVDNLPVTVVVNKNVDAVIAVDVSVPMAHLDGDPRKLGFAAAYMRAATIMMRQSQMQPLSNWSGPPMLLIQPPVSHIDIFSTSHTPTLIELGYQSAIAALRDYSLSVSSATGIFPKRMYRLSVDQDACIGCGLCVALAPNLMEMHHGRAVPRHERVAWSPAEGRFVKECPTRAIHTVEEAE